MTNDAFGHIIYDLDDVVDLLMQGVELTQLNGILVDQSVNFDNIDQLLDQPPQFNQYTNTNLTVAEFDQQCQQNWRMPVEYQNMDIAAHVLSLCQSAAELQRSGHELMLYQERNLFDLLRYLTYLVDVMRDNQVIWGVGRGSSVASYVLYLLGVHRINSMFYDLDVGEFLR